MKSAAQKADYMLFLGDKDFFYTPQEVTSFLNTSGDAKGMATYYQAGHELPRPYTRDVISFLAGSE